MAMERVVLAPAITGIPELISDRQTGFLYQQNSLPDFLDQLLRIAAEHHSSTLAEEPGGIFSCTSIVSEIWTLGLRISSVISTAPHKSKKVLMRILYCNKYNFRFSGTEAYLFETMDLMRSRATRPRCFRWRMIAAR